MKAYNITYQKVSSKENSITSVILLNNAFSIIKEENRDIIIFSDVRLGQGQLLSIDEIDYIVRKSDTFKSIDNSKIIERK